MARQRKKLPVLTGPLKVLLVNYGDPQENNEEWVVCAGSKILARVGRGYRAKHRAVMFAQAPKLFAFLKGAMPFARDRMDDPQWCDAAEKVLKEVEDA